MSKQTKKSPIENPNSPAATPRIGPMGRGNPMGMMAVAPKPKNFKRTMRQLGGYIKPFWLSITIVIVFTMASTIFAIFTPKILGGMTNQIVNDFVERTAYDQFLAKLPSGTKIPPGTTGADLLKRLPPEAVNKIPSAAQHTIAALDFSKRPVFDYQPLINIALELLTLFIMSAIFNYLQSWIMTNVSQKITYHFRRVPGVLCTRRDKHSREERLVEAHFTPQRELA